MILKTYKDMKIEIIQQSVYPGNIVSAGLQTCMKKDINPNGVTKRQVSFMLKSDHMSPLEHVSMTILVKGISRSLLAQITRHRTFKFSSSSQHYQDYSDYEMVIDEEYLRNIQVLSALNHAMHQYESLLSQDVPREEARQVLPGASAVNLMITADARNMINFFVQRLCKRNVKEMQVFANLWHQLAKYWFPEVFDFVGPTCRTHMASCNQGDMQAPECKIPKYHNKELCDEDTI